LELWWTLSGLPSLARQTDKQTDIKTDKQTDIKTDKQTTMSQEKLLDKQEQKKLGKIEDVRSSSNYQHFFKVFFEFVVLNTPTSPPTQKTFLQQTITFP
jgi:hypothetical protein